MLGSLKRSTEYDAVRKRVSDPRPLDAWRIRDENYFVFALVPAQEHDAEFALFKMRWDADGPELAMVVRRRGNAAQVEVRDLRNVRDLRVVSLEGNVT